MSEGDKEGELPPYKLTITKSRSSGGPTQYPSHDRVIAQISIPSEWLPDNYAFPFVSKRKVATVLEDDHTFHQVLRENGIEPVQGKHGVWDATVTTFQEAGVGRGDSVNTLVHAADGGTSDIENTGKEREETHAE